MNIFISGGDGMVGQNLRERLSEEMCNLLHPPREEVDLLAPRVVDEYFDNHRIDIVIHCAGLVGGIHTNMEHKDQFLSENIIMGLNLINAANRHGVKKLINLGSSCMYPKQATIPFSESSLFSGRCEPTNEGYAIAKNAIAKMCEFITCKGDREYKTIIPCNLYGRWDKFDPANSHLIASIINKLHKARGNEEAVEIWGDGESRREFLYAGDLADFLCYSINNFERIPSYLNVGTGGDMTINEYYYRTARIIGYRGMFSHNLSKPVGMKRKVLSISKLENLGWKAGTSFDRGVKKTYEFYKERLRIKNEISS